MSACEQRFMAAAEGDGAGPAQQDIQPMLGPLHLWQHELTLALDGAVLDHAGLMTDSALAQQALAINAGLQASQQQWRAQWDALAPAQSLAQQLDDKVVLLVFGKFNAGKSSLCNFLADRFGQQGHAVRYFHLEAGSIKESSQPFHEGATETTARLQGVCLGQQLVLLDTPGLHSVTDDNAALTQRFLESADGVLWLTSSTSPGQVQELDELARELRRGKVLLPIVTRSDCIEEDELDGVIVKCLRNKSAANRAVQEHDVQARAGDKLRLLGVDVSQLKVPVSVSVHMAKTGGDHASAGIARLYGALQDIVGPALAYKQRKPAEMLLHYLQEQVLGSLETITLPALARLHPSLQAEREALEVRQARMVQLAWREVVSALPPLLEQHAARRDVGAVCTELASQAVTAFMLQAGPQLDGYVLPTPPAPGTVELAVAAAYEPASGDGDNEPVGYEKLHAELGQAVHGLLADLAAQTIDVCGEALQRLEGEADALGDIVLSYQQRLLELAGQLRSGVR